MPSKRFRSSFPFRRSQDSSMAARRVPVMDSLEGRRLFTAYTAARFGAIAGDNRADRDAIQSGLNSVVSGDKIVFASGVYNFAGSITVPSGVILEGEDGNVLKFSGIAAGQFAVIIGGDGNGTTLNGLHIDGGAISMEQGSRYRNIRITGNDITGVAGSSKAAIACHKSNEATVIEGNTFHDFKGWGLEFWYLNNGSISKNVFSNITQAMHVMNPRNNNAVNDNFGVQLQRMGIELQQSDSNTNYTENLSVKGNIFYGWKNPYWDSFGLSIMPQNSKNVRIEDNYLEASFYDDKPAFKEPDSGGAYRFGMAAEIGIGGGYVRNNTIVGDWSPWAFVAAMKDTVGDNNKFYFTDKYGNKANGPSHYTTEPGWNYGNYGVGSWRGGVGSGDANLTARPVRPTPAGGPYTSPGGGGGEEGPQSALLAPNLSGVALDSSSISLNWVDTNDIETGYQVERSFDGRTWQQAPIKVLSANTTRFVDTGLKSGTVYYYRVKAIGADGLGPASATLRYMTKIVVKAPAAKATTSTSSSSSVSMARLFSDGLISM